MSSLLLLAVYKLQNPYIMSRSVGEFCFIATSKNVLLYIINYIQAQMMGYFKELVQPKSAIIYDVPDQYDFHLWNAKYILKNISVFKVFSVFKMIYY